MLKDKLLRQELKDARNAPNGEIEMSLRLAAANADFAWQQWMAARAVFLAAPSYSAQQAYDEAYAIWKNFGSKPRRGRPPGGDEAPTSNEKAKGLRARHQLCAERWEAISPYIQNIRHALRTKNSKEVIAIAEKLSRETEVELNYMTVVHLQPQSDFVVFYARDHIQIHGILAFVRCADLDTYFYVKGLSGKGANLVGNENINLFRDLMSEKYERGEYRPYLKYSVVVPRIDISLDDIRRSGRRLRGRQIENLLAAHVIRRDKKALSRERQLRALRFD